MLAVFHITCALKADAEASEPQSKGSGKRAFQRVVAEEWLGQKAARNNSYHSTFGNDGWGAGAQAILGQVAMLDFCYSQICQYGHAYVSS